MFKYGLFGVALAAMVLCAPTQGSAAPAVQSSNISRVEFYVQHGYQYGYPGYYNYYYYNPGYHYPYYYTYPPYYVYPYYGHYQWHNYHHFHR